MSTELSRSGTPAAVTRSGEVSLSKWVNEKLPPITELLSAHEVARLTRRHRWFLSALTLFGRFPKQERFRGRAIGWHRREVEGWLRSETRIARLAEWSPWPISAADTLLAYHTRYRSRSCTREPANHTRCSRRTRRRRWHHRSTPASRLPGDVSTSLPLKFEERSES